MASSLQDIRQEAFKAFLPVTTVFDKQYVRQDCVNIPRELFEVLLSPDYGGRPVSTAPDNTKLSFCVNDSIFELYDHRLHTPNMLPQQD